MKPLDIDNLTELVVRVKDGDEDAFIELYNKMHQKIYFLAISIVKDEYLAQDVIQETFISVYKNIGRLDNDRMFTAWINRIAYNCSLKMLSSHKEIPVEDIIAEREMSASKTIDPLDMVLSKDENNKIMKCILDLPPEFKTTLILRYYGDFKLEEIAVSMECSLGTVKSRLNRAKAALCKSIRSKNRVFSIFMFSGIALNLTLRSSMEAYAGEHAMTSEMASRSLAVIQKQKGAQVTAAAVSTNTCVAKSMINRAMVLAIGGAAVFGAGVFGLQDARINITGYEGRYTNQNIFVKVEVALTTSIPIKSIRLVERRTQQVIGLHQDAQGYWAEIGHNGSYYVEVDLMNGKTAEQEFEVSRIDREKPELYWYSWDVETGMFYGLVADNLSGIDFQKMYTEEKTGVKSNVTLYEESTGKFEIPLPQDSIKMILYDQAGNQAEYEISSHLNEQAL